MVAMFTHDTSYTWTQDSVKNQAYDLLTEACLKLGNLILGLVHE